MIPALAPLLAWLLQFGLAYGIHAFACARAERDLAMRLAAYNMVSVAVCDEDGRLLGAATVDDVLDKVLPPDWRRKERR